VSGHFSTKSGKKDIFKPAIGNENLYVISNDNGARVVQFFRNKNLTLKNTIFPHYSIHQFTWTSPDGKDHNPIDQMLIERRKNLSVLDVRSFKAEDFDTDQYLVDSMMAVFK
jgi:hypothetical protein